MDNYIKMNNMKHGYLYDMFARNGNIGIWNEETKGLVFIRTKFGERYLFTEYHWDFSKDFGTAKPIREIEKTPFTDIDEDNKDIFNYLLKKEEELA